MAREIRAFHVTIPSGTAVTAPQVTNLNMPARVVDEVEIRVPPGPRGEVGFALGSSGNAVIPIESGTFIVTDDEVIHWPLEGFHDSGGWQMFGYNTGQNNHTLEVRFLVSLPGARADQRQPLPVGEISPGPGGGIPPPPLLPVPPSLPVPPPLLRLRPQPPPHLQPLGGVSSPPPWTVSDGKELNMDAQAAAAFQEILNRLGDLQYFIDPGGGATSQGENTLRLRGISDEVGRVTPGTLAAMQGAIKKLQTDVAAIKAKVGA